MNNRIKATPTKEFFINMLTRDIPLGRAIIDLVDNSIDGAKAIRTKENYKGLHVNLTLEEQKFTIEDNCGGFPLVVAQEYAFRFGRPPQAKFVDHSIGRFGVGMKRALFKIGKHFTVESKNKADHFLIEVDVDEWLALPDNQWDFTYVEKENIPREKKILTEDGTVITVTKLYENISTDFLSDIFLNDLEKEISLALNFSILKGLEIQLNKKKIAGKEITFLWSKTLKPYYKKFNPQKDVTVKIYCGVGEPQPSVAGWYIFCNDRLVLEADKSYNTGWKEAKEDEAGFIKYHNKYAMFRGVVQFNSKDSSKLPMTTTKTGIDTDHPIYKSTRPEMLIAMAQVLSFLGKIDEKEIRDDIVNNSSVKDIEEIKESESQLHDKFISPRLVARTILNGTTTISYSRERKLVDKLRDYFNVSTNREVGEKTFDYFVNMNKREL